jgi:transposase-like protein
VPSTEPLIFREEKAARAALEALRWPNGANCPHCGSAQVAKVGGEKQTHRAGLFRCKGCRGQFTVTVGTVFERSKVPLNKWLHVIHLENSNAREVMTPWHMAQATGLTFKTIEEMRARIYGAVNTYDGPNTIFGRAITAHIGSRRPTPPKPRKHVDAEGQEKLDFGRWYRWRKKHPLGEVIPADGSLGRALDTPLKGIDSTERLIRLLIKTPKPPIGPEITVPSRATARKRSLENRASNRSG